MKDSDLKKRASDFAKQWEGRGYEKGESQIFWIGLLTEVFGVENPDTILSFENQVKLASTSFIDAYIKPTKVLIEQKSIEKDLRKPIKQSDGTLLTPFQQAKRYASELPLSKHPRWVVACNFKSFLVYDMENPQGEPEEIMLADLGKEIHRLSFLVEEGSEHLKREMEISIKAGELVGKLYDAFLEMYGGTETPEDLHSLNVLCVRLVFCFYAEDAGIFGKDQFYHYMNAFRPTQMRGALKELFEVLDTPVAKRDRFLAPELAEFPYVNGSLFRQQPGEDIPPFTPDTATLMLEHASLGFDWSEISPTIFGAVFESTLNPETRRSGGMHYTSIENIHRVIDPLFLDDLNEEFLSVKSQPLGKHRTSALTAFQEKIASLKFFDPACGSGNFLTETFMSLRRLENKIIQELTGGQAMLGFEEINPIKVKIHQFYGIEINDFAATVAKTALWIAEAQMMNETEKIIRFTNDYLPLKTYDNIKEGNALRVDWNEVVSADELDYIIGNPPFVGYSLQSKEQKDDILSIYIDEKGKPYKTAGKIDYVAGWYWKASEMMFSGLQNNKVIRTALVSTNSITQGEQVAGVWKPLYDRFGIHIDFAWRTFRWDSESSLKAHVHCVIVGFSVATIQKIVHLYTNGDNCKDCNNINAYLIDAEDVFLESRKKQICGAPEMQKGSIPVDDGNLIIEREDYEEFISEDPNSKQFIKPLLGAKEFINNQIRYCLWLLKATPADIRQCPKVLERVDKVRQFRLSSTKEATRKYADYPTRFMEVRQPESGEYIIVPSHSSERRRYIPLGFVSSDIISTNANLIIPNADIYDFGILTSNVHMAWVRMTCGRIKSDYRYSNDIVYNNFPWPSPTEEQKAKIEQTAQAILDARALYPDSSLADLYDEVTMPPELRRAHQQNDRAVMQAYGFPIKDFTESDCVAELLNMYKEMTEK